MTEPNAKRARLEDDDQAAIEVTPMDGGGGGGGGTYIFSRANFFFCGKSVCAHLGSVVHAAHSQYTVVKRRPRYEAFRHAHSRTKHNPKTHP